MGHFNMLPYEIMLEILSRLPTETVLECKCVSKPWRKLVRHPSFSQMHLKRLIGDTAAADDSSKSTFIFFTPPGIVKRNETILPMIPKFFYTEYDESLNIFSRKTSIKLTPPFQRYYIIGSCNGLVCFNAFNDINLGYKPAYICNPITREYIMLPEVQGKAFLTGFGYSPSTNQYKVVGICSSREDPNFGIVQVYTLGSGIGIGWRNVEKMGSNLMILGRQTGTFANGAIHWVDLEGTTILAFDLADEELHKLSSPPGLPPRLFSTLDVSGGFLCAYFKYVGGWDLWVLKKNENYQDVIWSREFGDSGNMFVKPITLAKSGALLGYHCVERNVYCYVPEASAFRLLVDFGEKFQFGIPHMNTLVSFKALGEEDTRLMDSGERARSFISWSCPALLLLGFCFSVYQCLL